jgi:Uma2 family endonuclease
MASIPVIRYTPQQYLEIERNALTKSEYVMGQMLAMAGGTGPHSFIAANVVRRLGNELDGKPCHVSGSDLKVNIGTDYFYPDVSVICKPKYLDNRTDVVLNPIVIVEVLSKSTEGYDLNYKLSRYSELASLSEILYISQDAYNVNHLVRQADRQWLHSVITDPTAEIHLACIDCTLTLAQIYSGILPTSNPE